MNKEQTCIFWHLQLQLFQLTSHKLLQVYYSIRFSDIYIPNKYTSKFDEKYVVRSVDYREIQQKDFECLATHLALQMAGINE
jgi:hypothetical protein